MDEPKPKTDVILNPIAKAARIIAITVGALMFLGTSLFFVLGVWTWTHEHWAAGTYTQTTGTVVRLVNTTRGTRASAFRPVARYVDSGGVSYEVEGSVGSDPPTYTVGQRVPVEYLNSDPSIARIATSAERTFFPALFGGIGLVGMLLSSIIIALGLLLPRILRAWQK